MIKETEYRLGTWICHDPLYDRMCIRIWQTQDPAWLVKENVGGRKNEIEVEIDFIGRSGPRVRNMVTVPADPIARSGLNWYAMRAYTGSVFANGAYARTHWRVLAEHVLNFLEDLHRDHGLVHLDLTQSNVFVDTSACQFVVGDYELLSKPEMDALHHAEDDYLWYFVEHGADLDEPNIAWRMDFVMLGYMLARLTWNSQENSSDWAFARECERRRKGRGKYETDADVIAERDSTLVRAHPTVVSYLDRVANLVPWCQVEAPAAEVYSELRALFL